MVSGLRLNHHCLILRQIEPDVPGTDEALPLKGGVTIHCFDKKVGFEVSFSKSCFVLVSKSYIYTSAPDAHRILFSPAQ